MPLLKIMAEHGTIKPDAYSKVGWDLPISRAGIIPAVHMCTHGPT